MILFMGVMLGFCAFAIDTANWYVKHHQAQVAADAASLAAANCLANAGSGKTCTSTTDTTDAQAVAATIAADNGLTVPTSDINVSTTANTVSVMAPNSGPSYFAAAAGIASASENASATAGWTASSSSSTPCTSANRTSCSAIYAGTTSCSGSGNGLTFGTANGGGMSVTVTGGVHSEGQMTFTNSTVNASSMTVTSNCYTTSNLPSDYGKSATLGPSQSWPIDYSKSPYFAPCVIGSTCVTVDGVANVPPYCSHATTTSGYTFTVVNGNAVLPTSGDVYCAIGTGSPNNPATWNGTINLNASYPEYAQSCSPPYPAVTFIAGTVTTPPPSQGGVVLCMSPAQFNCLIYATGNVTFENSTLGWTGDIFAPNGTIQFGTASAGLSASTASGSGGMLEGWNVALQNVQLTITGDGPVSSGSGSSSSGGGTDYLSQ